VQTKNPRIDGEKLKAARVAKFYDRSELAEMAGLDQRTVEGLERNEWAGGSRLSTIRKLAEALDIDPHELLAEDG
jgi:transcriptional regulator with XRE-family HTH domain